MEGGACPTGVAGMPLCPEGRGSWAAGRRAVRRTRAVCATALSFVVEQVLGALPPLRVGQLRIDFAVDGGVRRHRVFLRRLRGEFGRRGRGAGAAYALFVE